MGILFSIAAPGGTGPAGESLRSLQDKADRAAALLRDAPFVSALGSAPSPPAPAAADRVVVLGIGGSALGARAVHRACPAKGLLPITVVDNIDPDPLEEVWGAGDPGKTAWVVVSKSGGTTETLAQCAVVRERLLAADAWRDVHVVTGAKGPLLEMAERDRLPLYRIPEEVGGRFSVFTPAGTVPLALAGHDVRGLLEGARDAAARAAEAGSATARLATFLVAAGEGGRNVVTFWSYAERLETVGEWFRQLWAESLGKRGLGQTPLSCVGSTDQHSIQQLMVEGPPDKVAVVLAGPGTVETRVPAGGAGAGAGHSFHEILDAMRRATTAEMVRAGCPAATFRLEEWSERTLGGLLMVFLCATVLGGELLGVDPYGQPGVEAAKTATRELLSAPGGAAAQEIARLLGDQRQQRCL